MNSTILTIFMTIDLDEILRNVHLNYCGRATPYDDKKWVIIDSGNGW